jgi:DNA-binding response OmpR family regulator
VTQRTPARILVIDDNEDVRASIQLSLEAEGFEVAVAANGRSGMALLRERGADVVVTDILMPDQDGVETILEVRKEFPDVKIIAMSGATSARGFDYLAVPRELGAARILRKPFDIQQLIDMVRSLTGAVPRQ